jgi:uncharacterized protein YbjT (DUF2867 family)
MSSSPILITGAMGNIGRAVIAQLGEAEVPVRAVDLDPTSVAEAFGHVDAARFDFTDPATWTVFESVDTMFLVRPPALSNISRDMIPALEAAKRAGVQHMILLSLQGAENNKVVPHAKIEAWLRESGLAWTFVRPSFFMENLSTTHVSDIRDRDCLMVPAGKGATAFVASEDVARVATAALLDPASHVNRAWTPTGPQALTYDQVAATLTDVLGRPIRYGRPGIARYLIHATRTLDLPVAMALVTTAIYTIARLGKASGLTDDVQTVTGQAPIDFEQWAQRHRHVWQPDER